ncbi:MAG: ATP-binding cassette domain-containing protein, partial [Proteobacteria bacterium]|nr:ATP-binding cassette domain-containing protein [Pseudomonadota bacterium]
MIRVENLVKKYGSLVVSNSLNCRFEQGKITVILGGSGSGKSTLLRQLTGLERSDSGCVYFDGVDLTCASKKKL